MSNYQDNIKDDLSFLLSALKSYLEKMKKSLISNNLETFVIIYKQFNRTLGEIFGITKYGDGVPKTERDEVIFSAFKELDELMREAHEIEEEFLKKLSDSN